MMLPARVIAEIEERNRIGREFGRPDSKFLTKAVKKDTMNLKR